MADLREKDGKMARTANLAKVDGRPSQSTLLKVPVVTAWFWVVKILTTGFGEVASDALMHGFGAVAAIVIGLALIASLFWQFRSDGYRPAVYWTAVVMVAIFGTMAADVPHSLGVPLWATSIGYLVAVVLVFALWYRTQGTLSFSSIVTPYAEGFYWAAVLATFALGTAVGDLTADTWGWGNLASGLISAALITVPYAGVRWAGLPAVAGFWIGYVVTRPLGASFADWMSLPTAHGGLGLGAPLVSLMWAIPMIGLIAVLAVRSHQRG